MYLEESTERRPCITVVYSETKVLYLTLIISDKQKDDMFLHIVN